MGNLINPSNQDKAEFQPNVDNTSIKAQSSLFGKIIWYILFLLIIPIFVHVINVNKLKKKSMKINEMSSGIDIQLQKRADTLKKLVAATKSSMKYEKDVLTQITNARSNAFKGAEGAAKLDALSANIMAVAENYPNLKAEDNIATLMDDAAYLEREIAASRRLYNSEVTIFNQMLMSWPKNVPAAALKFTTMPLFKASTESKKDVDLNLDL